MSDGTDECDGDSGLCEPQTVSTIEVSLTFSTRGTAHRNDHSRSSSGYDSAGAAGHEPLERRFAREVPDVGLGIDEGDGLGDSADTDRYRRRALQRPGWWRTRSSSW
jgi:hypothetical protein